MKTSLIFLFFVIGFCPIILAQQTPDDIKVGLVLSGGGKGPSTYRRPKGNRGSRCAY